MSQIRQKLTIWWPKQCSVFEKVKPHRARILFWKLVKTCPIRFALPNFFILSSTMAQVELAHKKWAKSDENWRFGYQNKSSVFEKIKPHRARILFWKLVKMCPKWFALHNFFTIAQVELDHKKWAKSDNNWRCGDQIKVRCSKKLSLIERGYFFEN